MVDTTSTTDVIETVKGTWQHNVQESARLNDRSAAAKKKAGNLLWTGAKDGISDWLPGSDDDASGEALYGTLVSLMGKARRGDANKIKTVAVAVKTKGLVLDTFPNLAKAYGEAVRVTSTVKAQAAEDHAADEQIATIAEAAPKSTSTPEGAALLVLSKGVDEAARLLLDALGKDNAVHRSFLRAVSQEVTGRIPKPEPKPKAEPKAKAGATKAKAPGNGAAKAKPVAKSVSKGDPNKKALPAKAAPVDDTVTEDEVTGEVLDNGDMFDAIEEDTTPNEVDGVAEVDSPAVAETPTKGAPVKRAVPVRKGRG